jgi:ubiquinone/menaquinone biosynthesis C-methylase UbiE
VTNRGNLEQIESNIQIHDKIAARYEKLHGEIYNDIEQSRLRKTLAEAVDAISPKRENVNALDFGCGAGNLTKHFLDLGLRVTAADVSGDFLKLVGERFGPGIELFKLNGIDLREMPDNKFDFIATYSVLHHIPDYMAALKELVRVCRPGGVIYLDHEVNEGYWERTPAYRKFLSEGLRPDWKKYMRPSNYINKVRRIFNPKFTNEGDIHVWPDDHIEWDLIEKNMKSWSCQTVLCKDYLHYNKQYREDVYRKYQDVCSDMRVMAFRKQETDRN